MKYLFKSYSPFFYTAFLACMFYLFIADGEKLTVVFGGEYYTLTTRSGLSYSAMVFGIIWLLYIGQNEFLYSKKLVWFHFLATLVTVAATCWYHSQGFEGRMVTIGQASAGRYSGGYSERQYFVLPFTWLFVLAVILAQVIFITHVVKGKTSRY